MKLNYREHLPSQQAQFPPTLLIHGLFGSLDNLGILGRDLRSDRKIIQVDMRNHGHSPRSERMDYAAMAEDLLELIDDLSLPQLDVIGHSMGGKAAMTLAALAPERIRRLALLDIAPVDYKVRRHDTIFTAINAVTDSQVTRRQDAADVMRHYLQEEGVIQFLLKSFQDGAWLFNVPALWAQYENIVGWQDVAPYQGPVMFIKGGLSPYIQDSHREAIARQFPHARAHVIAGVGHWLHAEKPELVLRTLHRFLDSDI
ncbi:esterase [Hafnia paralvei ATCC 29927]|jgi:esterase|uniref:Alpha/beta hydrolase n=1 Tax=Hafnia paralvei TaxID=546367 RepID=A0A2A2MGC5_9GAMM|nr:esterase [Hafnia paralvei]MDU1193271.1 esterase [Enterobacteriaceae bacterium]KHS46218.1 acyl-CoA esterase [Hafnia paralvei]MDU1242768.1 esterase [Enterobacteriaceae bacterium]OAT39750.1 esterase [Hafnia paralvei ATCC 29927]PAV98167.1 alpha/beta hydrolase [Hafnia paralvei]